MRHQKRLVAQQVQLRLGIVTLGDQLAHDIGNGLLLGHRSMPVKQRIQHDPDKDQRDNHTGPQETGCIRVNSKLPQQGVAVFNMAIGEQANPENSSQQGKDADDPNAIQPEHRCRIGPVKRGAKRPQQAQRQAHAHGFFPV